MKKTFLICMLATIAGIIGCGSPESRKAEVNYDAMAGELCKCLRPMFDFQEQIMQLVMEGKDNEIMALREKAIELESEGEACVKALEAKYGIIEGEEKEAKATEALRKACPDIVNMMEGAFPDPSMIEDMPLDEMEEELDQMEQELNGMEQELEEMDPDQGNE